jgi:hypothetical protein
MQGPWRNFRRFNPASLLISGQFDERIAGTASAGIVRQHWHIALPKLPIGQLSSASDSKHGAEP